MQRAFALLAPILTWLAFTSSARAQDPVQLELLSDVVAVEPGGTFKLAVRAQIEPGWHIYWTNPGDSGLPTLVEWTAPDGFEAGALQYPIPHRYVQKVGDDFMLVSHTFEGEAYFISEFKAPEGIAPGSAVTISASVDWQACKEVCTPPMNTPLEIELSVADTAAPSPDAAAIAKAWGGGQAGAEVARATVANDGGQLALVAKLPDGKEEQYSGDLFFLPAAAEISAAASEQIAAREGSQLSIWTDLAKKDVEIPEVVRGFVVGEGAAPLWVEAMLVKSTETPVSSPTEKPTPTSSGAGSYPPSASPEAEPIRAAIKELASGIEKKSISLLLMLAAAFLGGIILNLMPCVFPVLGIKILGFVQQAGSDRAKIRRHGWVFALGVILSLWALVAVLLIIRAAGASAGWGFQLQEPWFVIFLIAIMFIFALNLAGVFELGTSLTGTGAGLQAQHGYGGSFFSGVLAVLVATPCTGPFMGPALGFALSGPAYTGFAIFTALALGLALPYVVLSYFPALIEKLPRPGPWMETFKQAMSFPLFATVVWLLAVLGKGQGQGAILWVLIGLIVLSLGFWLYGRYATPLKKPPTRWTARAATALAVLSFVYIGSKAVDSGESGAIASASKTVHGLEYEPFDPVKALEYVKAGKNVFVDYTAVW